jgi:hypothetical protein
MQVAVFVRRGAKSWRFEAYSRDFNAAWGGCNLVEVPESVLRQKTSNRQRVGRRRSVDLGSTLPPRFVLGCWWFLGSTWADKVALPIL